MKFAVFPRRHALCAVALWVGLCPALVKAQEPPPPVAPPAASTEAPPTMPDAGPAVSGEAAAPPPQSAAPAAELPPAPVPSPLPAPAPATTAPVDAKVAAVNADAPSLHLFARVNSVVQGENPKKLNDYRFESILVVPGFKGQVKPWFSYTFNAVGYAESFDNAQLRILDATAQFKIAAPLQVWAGRLVVPFDRFNLSGPFRNLIWNFPGFYAGRPRIGGENSQFGRDSGVALWGSVLDGAFKYQAMVHQLEHGERSPRFSGRLSVSLLDREPGYFVSSSYLGERDVIAVGVGAQYQSDGRLRPNMDATLPPTVLGDLWSVTADVFVEKRFGDAGTATLEAAYYRYDEQRAMSSGYYGVLAYLLPWQLGVGQAQVGVRAQRALAQEDLPTEHDLSGLDVSASYLMNGFNLRLAADYSRQWLGDGLVSNAVSLGLQFGRP